MVLPGGVARKGHGQSRRAGTDPAGSVGPRRAARAQRPAGRAGRVVRVPLQVLGRALGKAWQDRILGLSAEASFWQILSVPPLLIGLLGSLGYLGHPHRGASVHEIEDRLLDGVGHGAHTRRGRLAGAADADRHPGFRPARRREPGLRAVALGRLLGDGDVHQHHRHRLRPARRPRADPHPADGAVAVPRRPGAGGDHPAAAGARPRRAGGLFPALAADGQLLVNAVYWPLVLVAAGAGADQLLPRDAAAPAALAPAPARRRCWRWPSSSSRRCVLRAYVADILTTALPYGALAAPIAVLLFASSSAWRSCSAPSSTPPSRTAGPLRCGGTTGAAGSGGRPSSSPRPAARARPGLRPRPSAAAAIARAGRAGVSPS